MAERRKYNALRNIPWEVRSSIRDRIEEMVDGNEKTILYLYFVSGLSSTEIIQYCKEHDIQSRCHTNYTLRSIQYLIRKNFPEIAKYRKPNRENEKRKAHFKFIRENRRTQCVNCGSEDSLEWHHRIPLDMGGTSDPENMECLCKACHVAVTNYQRRLGFIRSCKEV